MNPIELWRTKHEVQEVRPRKSWIWLLFGEISHLLVSHQQLQQTVRRAIYPQIVYLSLVVAPQMSQQLIVAYTEPRLNKAGMAPISLPAIRQNAMSLIFGKVAKPPAISPRPAAISL